MTDAFTFGQVEPPEVDRDLVVPDEVLAPGDPVTVRSEGTAPECSELQVRAALAAVGGLAGFALGNRDIPRHWRPSDDELDDLTPPITRMVNASPRLREIVARSDLVTAGMVMLRYTLRNADLQRRWKDDHPDDDQLDPAGGGSAAGASPGAAGGSRPHGSGGGDVGDARPGAR